MTASSLMRAPSLGSSTAPPIRMSAERAQDRVGVDALIDDAFGPGRYAKTAERLRERGVAHPELSICAWEGERLAGAVRLWPARIGDCRLLFLGPIAVERERRGHGLGAELVEQACRRACTAGEAGVILVGDMGFFGPLGFEHVPAARVQLPGPVDPQRVLWRVLSPGALDAACGMLSAARRA